MLLHTCTYNNKIYTSYYGDSFNGRPELLTLLKDKGIIHDVVISRANDISIPDQFYDLFERIYYGKLFLKIQLEMEDSNIIYRCDKCGRFERSGISCRKTMDFIMTLLELPDTEKLCIHCVRDQKPIKYIDMLYNNLVLYYDDAPIVGDILHLLMRDMKLMQLQAMKFGKNNGFIVYYEDCFGNESTMYLEDGYMKSITILLLKDVYAFEQSKPISKQHVAHWSFQHVEFYYWNFNDVNSIYKTNVVRAGEA